MRRPMSQGPRKSRSAFRVAVHSRTLAEPQDNLTSSMSHSKRQTSIPGISVYLTLMRLAELSDVRSSPGEHNPSIPCIEDSTAWLQSGDIPSLPSLKPVEVDEPIVSTSNRATPLELAKIGKAGRNSLVAKGRICACLPNALSHICEVHVFALILPLPYGSESIAAPSRHKMHMKVEDRLLSGLASRGNQIHTVWFKGRPNRTTYLDHCHRQVAGQGWFELPQVSYMYSRDNQSVTRCCWIQRKKSYPLLGSADYLYGAVVTAGDAAEVTVHRTDI